MSKTRLEKIKEIHEEANEAYSRFDSSSAYADQDIITDNLNTLFYEEHTDWLIDQADKAERYEKVLKQIAYGEIKGWSGSDVLSKVRDIANETLKEINE